MALTGQYVDLAEIVETLFRDYPLNEEIFVADAAVWASKCLNIMGVPEFYIERITNGEDDNPDPVVIEDFRGELPLDMNTIVMARDYDTLLPMYCTASPFKADITYPADPYTSSLTYYTNDTFIFTSFETGNVEIIYRALPTSPMGLPMIPADEKIQRAVVSFIAEKMYKKLYLEGRVPKQIYDDILQDYLFNVGAGQNKARIPSMDQMEALKGRWFRLVMAPNLNGSSFRYIADKDRLILHTVNAAR